MNAQEIIDYIANSEKKTPVKLYVNTTAPVDFGSAKAFGGNNSFTVFGDWSELQPILEANAGKITDYVVENDRRNSGVPLLDLKGITDTKEESFAIRDTILGKMAALRAVADEAETQTAEKYWPFPTYGDLLFGVR